MKSYKTANGLIQYEAKETGELKATFYLRQTKSATKAGITVDESSPVITLELLTPDEFKTTKLKINSFKEESKEIYNEFLDNFHSLSNDNATFIQVSYDEIGNNEILKESLKEKGYDEKDGLLERERPLTSYTAIYMSIGTSLGLVFSLAVFHNIIFMSIGILLGIAIGGGIDASYRNARNKLKEDRKVNKTNQ